MEDLEEEKDPPDEWCAISGRPEDVRVCCTYSATLLCILSVDVPSHGSCLLMLSAFIRLVNVYLVAKLVDVAVPSKVYKQSASNVFHCPKIEGCKNYHDNERQDFFVEHDVEEEERKE